MAKIITDVTNGVANGSLWTVPVMINRSNKLPLDKYSLFFSKAAAEDYATSPTSMAYVGQILTVATLNETGKAITDVTVYVIDENSALKEVGKESDLSSINQRLDDIDATLLTINETWVTGIVNNILADKGYLTSEHTYQIIPTEAKNEYKLQTSINNGESWSDVSTFSFDYSDMVVSGGSLVDITKDAEGHYKDGDVDVTGKVSEEGKHIKLTIANSGDVIYINVKDLVDLYSADEETLTLQDRTFKAKLTTLEVDGSITESTKNHLVSGQVMNDYLNHLLGWETIGI